MAEAKHAFVDDYPYLVYSPNAETTFEGGALICKMTYSDGSYYIDKTVDEIMNAAFAGFVPVLFAGDKESGISCYQFNSAAVDSGTGDITVKFMSIYDDGNTSPSLLFDAVELLQDGTVTITSNDN